jgi:protein phosphatase
MPTLTMRSALRSELGRRPNNEDAVFATPRLVAVADGVGGAAAGEVASHIVIQEMASLEKRRLANPLADELRTAVRTANEILEFMISCRPRLAGMASTLTAVALSNEGRYVIANVGDSRAYLFRDHGLHQLTRDGSLVQALIDSGAITPEQARTHPQRSVVLDALDGAGREELELVSHEARVGDRILLCSDGLSDFVPDPLIVAALENPSRDRAADDLVEAALRAGGADNVSVVVVDVAATYEAKAGWLEVLPPTVAQGG